MTTCEPSLFPDLSATGLNARMLSPEASPVRTFRLRERWAGSTRAGADYGVSYAGLLAKFDPPSRSWRTSQVCFAENGGLGLAEFSETWPRSGMMRNGIAFQLPPLAPLTDGIVSGLLPTPDKSIARIPASAQANKVAKNNRGERLSKMGTSIAWCEEFLAEWRTTGGELNPQWLEAVMGYPTDWTAAPPLATP